LSSPYLGSMASLRPETKKAPPSPCGRPTWPITTKAEAGVDVLLGRALDSGFFAGVFARKLDVLNFQELSHGVAQVSATLVPVLQAVFFNVD